MSWRTILIWVPDDNTQEKTSGGGTVALVDAIVFAWKTAKAVWWMASNFAIGLAVIAVGLYLATRWTVKGAKRAHLAVRRRRRTRAIVRWHRRTVAHDRQPVAAITATTTAMTLADLKLKQEANAR